jgi:hypothetical protein
MSLHVFQNQNAFVVGLAQRWPDGSRTYSVLQPGASIVCDNDPTRARPFNPSTKQWVAYSTLTDLGAAATVLAQCEDNTTWPTS